MPNQRREGYDNDIDDVYYYDYYSRLHLPSHTHTCINTRTATTAPSNLPGTWLYPSAHCMNCFALTRLSLSLTYAGFYVTELCRFLNNFWGRCVF